MTASGATPLEGDDTKDATGAAFAGAVTVMVRLAVPVRPALSVAVTVTTVFAARGGTRLQATSAVVLPRRG